MAIKAFRVRVTTHDGKAASGVTVNIEITVRGGKTVSAPTNGAGIAEFKPGDLLGKPVKISVAGRVYASTTIQTNYPNSHPTADIKLDPPVRDRGTVVSAPAGHDAHAAPAGHDAHAAPAGHDAHAAPAGHDAHSSDHHGPKKPDGVMVTVLNKKGEHVYGAAIRVKGVRDAVYTYDPNEDWIDVPPPTKDTSMTIFAEGFVTKTVDLDNDVSEVRVRLEAEASKTTAVSWPKVTIFMLIIAAIGVIGYVASVIGPSAQSIMFNPLANASGDPIAQSIMKFSTWAALIVVIVGRARLGQWWDVISAVVFLGVSFLAEWLSPLNALDPAFIAAMPQGVNQVIEFFRYFRWVIYIVAIAWMYWAAWNNTPDLSMPGAIWDVISLIVFTQGNRMGLPVSDTMGQIQLAMGLKVFAALHYLADMFQVPQMVMKKEVKPKLDPIFFGIMTLALFVGAMVFMSPGIAAFASLLVAGLFTEMLEEVTKNYDPDRAPLQLGKMLQFMKTNKADGVLFAAFIINVLGWFGVWTFLFNAFRAMTG